MTFKNGYTISVQWGPGNYCSKQSFGSIEDFTAPSKTRLWESATAEIAIWDAKGQFVRLSENDDVFGHQTPEEVATWIQRAMSY